MTSTTTVDMETVDVNVDRLIQKTPNCGGNNHNNSNEGDERTGVCGSNTQERT